jgi:hypothetical protein
MTYAIPYAEASAPHNISYNPENRLNVIPRKDTLARGDCTRDALETGENDSVAEHMHD